MKIMKILVFSESRDSWDFQGQKGPINPNEMNDLL